MFLLYSEANQLYVYLHTLPLEPASHPNLHPTLPPSLRSRSSQNTKLCIQAAFHELSVLHMVVYICQFLIICTLIKEGRCGKSRNNVYFTIKK